MDHNRWEQIEDLLQRSLDLELGERAAFLDQTCAEDKALRSQVEALLSKEAQAESFMESPAVVCVAEQISGPSPEPPSQISHYHIEARIGEGGMGEVYRAYDETLRRAVALKMLPSEFTADPERVQRFQQEAFAASRLNHPNIITIFEITQADEAHFIAEEFVEGETLRELLTDPQTKKTRKLGVDKALDIAIQIAGALKAAHTAWIIHRDIKPENIMVRQDGLVKVLDFGIAKLGEQEFGVSSLGGIVRSRDIPPEGGTPNLTTPGAIMGTASYMSPEQARGEQLDGRTDLFSLGLILYEMVTGERLFTGATRAEALQAVHSISEALPPNLRLGQIPKDLQRIIRKALRRDRDERYASAGELLYELETLKHRLENRTSRRIAKVSALVLLLVVSLTAVAALASLSEVWDEQIMRDGHTAAVRRAVFSPDGRLLVSVSEDKQVIVWDFARRERVKTLTDHTGWVTSVAFSPDGKWFATGSYDHTVIVWDTARLEKVRVLNEHQTPVQAVAFSPNGRLLASGSSEEKGRMIVWDTERWEKVRELPKDTGYGTILFSPDSQMLVTVSGQWDLATGQQVVKDDEGWNWAAFSPDARRMFKVGSNGEVSYLMLSRPGEIVGSRTLAHARGHQDFGRALVVSPNGKLIASGSENILVWDAATMTKLGRFEYDAVVWGLAFSPDGRWLVSTHGDGAILVWDMAERARAASFNGHADAVRATAFSPDGSRFASAGEDRSVIIWNAASGRKEAVLNAHNTRVIGVVYSPDGNWLASSDQDGYLIRWNVEARQPRWRIKTDFPDNVCLAISPDGRCLAVRAGVYESGTGQRVVNFELMPLVHPDGTAFSHDGRRLACVGQGGVLVLETETWRVIDRQYAGDLPLVSVSFSPDGRRLVTGSVDGTLLLWEATPLRHIATLGQHAARVKSLAFSPDGAAVASAGDDKMIALWDVSQRKLITRIGTHTSPVYSIAFSPDGKSLVSGEHDHSVRLYTRHRTLWGFRLD